MSDKPYTDEDVTAGAKDAFFTDMIGGHHNGLFTWETIPEEGRENYRKMVASVLTAVAPAIAARALRQAVDKIEFLTVPPVEWQGTEVHGLMRAANVLRAMAEETER